MRKMNAVVSMGVVTLFLIHMIAGGFQLAGIIPGGSQLLKILTYLMAGLILVHAVIGIRLTWDSVSACRKAGVSYFTQNSKFWAVRISGLAIMVLIAFHVIIFLGNNEGVFRLNYFGAPQLVSQILLVLSIAVHVTANVKPVLISFGIRSLRPRAGDILVVLAVLLLLAGAAFIVYYLRWQI